MGDSANNSVDDDSRGDSRSRGTDKTGISMGGATTGIEGEICSLEKLMSATNIGDPRDREYGVNEDDYSEVEVPEVEPKVEPEDQPAEVEEAEVEEAEVVEDQARTSHSPVPSDTPQQEGQQRVPPKSSPPNPQPSNPPAAGSKNGAAGNGTNGSRKSSTAPSSESATNDDDCLGKPDGNGNKYLFTEGLVKCSSSKGKIKRVIVTNFRVLSLTPIVRDDGGQQTESLRLELAYKNQNSITQKAIKELTLEEFSQTNWHLSLFDQRATITPRMKDYAMFGIQLAAPHKPREIMYTATGWFVIDGKPYFLHNDGAIGAKEHRRDLKAELKEDLQRYSLPDPPTEEQLKKAVRASLNFLYVGEPSVAVPMFASVWRAPLGNVDFMGWGYGKTGSMKTSHAVVAQQFYGKGFDKQNLPARWSSTGNFSQYRLHAAKDVFEVIDDFVLQGSRQDNQRRIAEADRLARSTADGASRGRLDAKHSDDTPSRRPRGLVWATAETNPLGESGQARLIAPTYRKKDEIPISIDLPKLSVCQAEAKSGLYSEAMAGYIQFLAKQYKDLFQNVQDRVQELRAKMTESAKGQHLRIPEILANLAVGIEYFLNFAKSAGAIDEKKYQEIWKHCWDTLVSLGKVQTQRAHEEDPVREALRFLSSADRAGRLIFRNPDPATNVSMKDFDNAPAVDVNQNQNRSDWFVGWRKDKDSDWLCDPEQLWKVIHDLFRERGREIPKTRTELFQEMESDGWITPRGEKDRPGVKRSIQGRRQRVIEIPAGSFDRLEKEGA